MKPPPFDYIRVHSEQECLEVLAEVGDEAKILAGGQSLMPILAMRLARPSVLIDINRLPGRSYIDAADDEVRIGSLTRHADLARQTSSPLLAEAAGWIGHPAIRTRGTIGGSIAHADPSAEFPLVLTALEGRVKVVGARGIREIAASELFVSTMETVLDGELIVEVRLPVTEAWGFAEFSRRHGDFGLVSVAAAVVGGNWRVALGGVAATPHRARAVEALLDGGALDEARIRAAAKEAAADIAPTGDLHATAEYKMALAVEFTERAIRSAIASSTRVVAGGGI